MILARVSVMRHGGTRSPAVCILQYGCLIHWLQPRCFSQMLVRPFSWPSSLFLSALHAHRIRQFYSRFVMSSLSSCSGALYLSAHNKLLD